MSTANPGGGALFAAAITTLAAGTLAIGLLASGPPAPGPGGSPPPATVDAPPGEPPPRRAPGADPERVAADFVRAYLRYQTGGLLESDRDAITATATASFRERLLGSPARAPAGLAPPRERLLGVAAVRVSVFDGEPALRVEALVRGAATTRVMLVTLLGRGDGWRVAGVGP